MYAEVLVEYTVKSLDKTFTYLIPDFLKDKLKVGMKVLVPFGKLKINGFVIKIKDTSELSNFKEIINITDYNFILNKELLELGKYLSDLTLCSLISAYQCMLPSSMKVKTINSNYQKYNEYIEIKNDNKALEYIHNNSRKIKQGELLNRLLNKEKILKSEYSNSIINPLLNLDLIEIKKEIKYRINNNNQIKNQITLTKEQQEVVKEVQKSLSNHKIFLLYGITGSGKTEVYIKLIQQVVKMGKKVMMLVPEISLSTQMINRFYNSFGNDVAIFHSGLSEGEKYDEYHKVLDNKVHIVVGTRSAVFVPFDNIGLIILDEEQSSNYKQDTNPRYHTKDIAIKRSEYHNCPLILGSATPSLESMARALKGNYQLLTLKNRIGNAKMPLITLVDMQNEYRKNNFIISDLLDRKIKERLNKHEQIIIFLNRRGFNTYITCKNCGYTYKCPHCDITLTYHKIDNNLRCHYCGYTKNYSNICPKCNEKALTSYGIGTEKLEAELKMRYNANIKRMDLDTTSRKGSLDSLIKEIEQEKVDIIVGTQMISKGFDFPKVTLVGVINGDESLNIPDFRSGEKTFELLTQTSGRAGRSLLAGEVIIQTFNMDNKTLNFVKDNSYENLFNYEMKIRKVLKYPPYYYLTLIKVIAKDELLVKNEALKVYEYLEQKLDDVIILGPNPANMYKINNKYRYQIIIKYKNYDKIKSILKEIDSIYLSNSKILIEIDNNPSRI